MTMCLLLSHSLFLFKHAPYFFVTPHVTHSKWRRLLAAPGKPPSAGPPQLPWPWGNCVPAASLAAPWFLHPEERCHHTQGCCSAGTPIEHPPWLAGPQLGHLFLTDAPYAPSREPAFAEPGCHRLFRPPEKLFCVLVDTCVSQTPRGWSSQAALISKSTDSISVQDTACPIHTGKHGDDLRTAHWDAGDAGGSRGPRQTQA